MRENAENDGENDKTRKRITFEAWLEQKELKGFKSVQSLSSRSSLSPPPKPDYLPEVRQSRLSAQSAVLSQVKTPLIVQPFSPTAEVDVATALKEIGKGEKETERRGKLLKRVNVLHGGALEERGKLDEEVFAAVKSKLALVKTS